MWQDLWRHDNFHYCQLLEPCFLKSAKGHGVQFRKKSTKTARTKANWCSNLVFEMFIVFAQMTWIKWRLRNDMFHPFGSSKVLGKPPKVVSETFHHLYWGSMKKPWLSSWSIWHLINCFKGAYLRPEHHVGWFDQWPHEILFFCSPLFGEDEYVLTNIFQTCWNKPTTIPDLDLLFQMLTLRLLLGVL